jgi:hypothetical protein
MRTSLRLSVFAASMAFVVVGCGYDQASVNASDSADTVESELRSNCIRDAFAQAGTPFDADAFRQKVEACIAEAREAARDAGRGFGGGFGGRDAGFPGGGFGGRDAGFPSFPSFPSFDAGVPGGPGVNSCSSSSSNGVCTIKRCVDGVCTETTSNSSTCDCN